MSVGINITPNLRAELGEIKEYLLDSLDKNNVKYDIPFDKINKQGIKETIIHIKECGTEVSVENDIITYIKSDNNEFTHLDTITDISDNVLNHIKNIQEKIMKMFNDSNFNMNIEKMDTKTMNITVILTSDKMKIRVQAVRDTFGSVYVNTIRIL